MGILKIHLRRLSRCSITSAFVFGGGLAADVQQCLDTSWVKAFLADELVEMQVHNQGVHTICVALGTSARPPSPKMCGNFRDPRACRQECGTANVSQDFALHLKVFQPPYTLLPKAHITQRAFRP